MGSDHIFRLLPEFLIGDNNYLDFAASHCYICGQTYDPDRPETPPEVPERPDLRGPTSENRLQDWRRVWVNTHDNDSYVHSMHMVRINKKQKT
jgi:hypothetical protein